LPEKVEPKKIPIIRWRTRELGVGGAQSRGYQRNYPDRFTAERPAARAVSWSDYLRKGRRQVDWRPLEILRDEPV